jgi:hypothetical protein
MTEPITSPVYRRERFDSARARGEDPRGRQPVRTRRCGFCGHRTARTKDGASCLECVARILAHDKTPWSPDEADLIERYYGLMTRAALQGYLYRFCGTFRTQIAIHDKAREMGIKARTHQDAVTITELAELLGINRSQVYNRVAAGDWMSIGHGKFRLIPFDEVDRILNTHPPFPSDPITRHQAAAILAYSKEVLSQLTRAGRLHKWQLGRQVYWSRRQVEALARTLREQHLTAREVLPPMLLTECREKGRMTARRRRARQRMHAN